MPLPNQHGFDQFAFHFEDPGGLSSPRAYVDVNITSVNQAPSVSSSTVTVSTLGDQSKNITLAATDPDDELFHYTILSLPARGRLIDTATGQTIDAVPYTFQNVLRKDVMVTFEPIL